MYSIQLDTLDALLTAALVLRIKVLRRV